MPVLLAGWEPDHITGAYLLDRSAGALGPADARDHDEDLPERMGMPGGSCAGFEGHASALHMRRIGEKRIDAYCSGEPFGWSWRGRLGSDSSDVHI